MEENEKGIAERISRDKEMTRGRKTVCRVAAQCPGDPCADLVHHHAVYRCGYGGRSRSTGFSFDRRGIDKHLAPERPVQCAVRRFLSADGTSDRCGK